MLRPSLPFFRITRAGLAPLAAGVFLAALVPASAFGANAPVRKISVTATGSVETPPDEAEITAGTVSDAASAKAALQQNNAAVSKIVETLKARGVAAKDMQTSNFSVQPIYDKPKDGKAPVLHGYRVENLIHVTVHDLPALGGILDTLVGDGANRIDRIRFGLTDPTAQENEARKRAMAAAIAKAKLYAKAAGAKLGEVLTISEDQPVYRPLVLNAARAAMATRSVPIEAGTAKTTVRVHVSWELD